MSRTAKDLLVSSYDVVPEEVHVVPHGVPERSQVPRAAAKEVVGSGGRALILSFGLVGPGKGYEHAIDAMATVSASIPQAEYVILGATHPDLIAHEGERYRESLQRQSRSLDLAHHVRFDDQFVSPARLGLWLAATDVFVTPYPNLEQIVSGTLSYALGAGKAIVSTRYAYATEMLGDGAGLLVETSATSIAAAMLSILRDPSRQRALERSSLSIGEHMHWPEVASAYADVFERSSGSRRRVVYALSRRAPIGA